ncbi:T9SS type A sorting domain-containing protein [candidate division WOR-3 bacterium]|nr:T9SS type A sorting domain-containing protein [candidate division WOR-3 bacterium]
MKRMPVLAGMALLLWPLVAVAVYDSDTLNVNRWRLPVTDWGPFGQGGKWRAPNHEYLFGCGLWVGAIAGGDTLTTVGYNPNSGGSEMAPGDTIGGVEDPDVIVYLSTGQWPPPQGRFPRAPQTVLADQDLWTLFNDLGDSAHVPPGRPLGLQCWLSAYERSHRSAQDMVFFKCVVENQSAETLRQVHVGVTVDYDIGDATDDVYDALYHEWVRDDSVYVDNLAIGYDYNNREPGWDSVGALGVSILSSPGAERASVIKKFSIDIDPVTDRDQYLTLAGYDYRTGVYCPIDSVDFAPADKRMLLACGPFDLAPAAPDSLVFVILASTIWPSRYGLAVAATEAESIWAGGGPGVAEACPSAPPARFQASPNPFRGLVRFSTSDPHARAVHVFDAAGRLVASVPITHGSALLSQGPALTSGVYFGYLGRQCLKLVRQE